MEGSKSLSDVLKQVQDFVGGLSARQRFLLLGGALVVAATLWVFVSLIGKPKTTTLYTGLRPADAQAIGARLAAKNIAYELSPDSSALLVAVDKLDAARLETAAQGLPRNARLGFELFDTPNWAGSDFSEKVNYQRALEGELERTLQSMSEVEAVRVHLVMPRESLFTEQEHDAKAAVILKTRTGRLSQQAQLAIPELVASAVDRLRPENVTVVDADSNAPLLRPRGAGGRAAYDLDEELAQTITRTLEPVVGAEHVRASVHVEYDLSTSEDTQEIFDPKATAATSLQRSEENMGGGGPAGIPGTASNVPGAAAATAIPQTAAETQSSRSESSTYAVSKSVHHSVQPAGRIKRIAAAVLVDDVVEGAGPGGKPSGTRRKRTPEEMKEIEQLTSAAIGIDTQRGDLLAVENLSFQTTPVESVEAPTKLDRWRTLLQQWSSLLRYVGVGLLFLVVYLLILRPVKKQALAAFRELPAKVAAGSRALAGASVAVSTLQAELPQSTEEGKRAAQLKRQLTEKVRTEPGATSRLVAAWMREPNTK
ncbi:MAG TPA: flagellar basal-body MS-ring/collar protein FliF [Terriglobales bacterium]